MLPCVSNISGTYNNQYMVLDLKKVHIKKRLDEGTLYIVEQIPTYVEYSEQTNVLRKGTIFPACQDWVPVCVFWLRFCCCDTLRASSLGVELFIFLQSHVTLNHGGRVKAGTRSS